MHSDRLEDPLEARLIQLRQLRLCQQSKAENRGSRNKPSPATGYASDAVKTSVVLMPGMSFMTDAVKTSVVLMPGMSFMTPQSRGPFYTTKHMSIGPAGG